MLSSMTLVRFGDAQDRAQDPAQRDLLAAKEKLEQQIDELKYRKAAMPEAAYASQLKSLLVELARTQAALDR
jgi:hypothetical protein